MLSNPRYEIQNIATTTLVGTNDQVDQNDFGASIAIIVGDGVRPASGEFLSFIFTSRELGTGAVQTPAGSLYLFYSDPGIDAGDTVIPTSWFPVILGRVDVSADDWIADANGANACILDKPIPFPSLTAVYAVWLHTDATSFNDAAGDDELLLLKALYRRDT